MRRIIKSADRLHPEIFHPTIHLFYTLIENENKIHHYYFTFIAVIITHDFSKFFSGKNRSRAFATSDFPSPQ